MDRKITFRCAIYIGKYAVNVYSNYSQIFAALRKGPFTPFIPEYRCRRRKAPTPYSILYFADRTPSGRMLNENQTLEIKGPVKGVVEAATLPFRAHFMLEQQLQKNSIFSTQGSGISRQGKGVLLMGKRGAGKTSITLELCRKYHYKLVGNDLILAGMKNESGHLFGGAKVFTLRFTTVKYYNTDLQKLFKKSRDEWTNKITVFPKDLGIPVEKGMPTITRALYVHLLNDASAPLFIRRVRDKELAHMGRLYLYEALSEYIRGVSTPLVHGSRFRIGDYLPSVDKPEYHQNRVKFIDWLMDEVRFYFVSGSMDAICNFINQDLRS